MKKILIVDVPDGYEFTCKTMEIHNPTIPHLGATQYPEFIEITLPTDEEIKKVMNKAEFINKCATINTSRQMSDDLDTLIQSAITDQVALADLWKAEAERLKDKLDYIQCSCCGNKIKRV